MEAVLMCLKKEYWEEKNILLGLPIGLATILIVSLIIALFVGVNYASHFDFNINLWSDDRDASSLPLDFTQELQSYEGSHNFFSRESELNSMSNSLFQEQFNQDGDGLHNYGRNANSAVFGLIFIFMSVSWFAGLSYLLSSLYKDRKDKTIFFWKSLPVSEQMNVFVKLFFGTFCYTSIALVIAWITCIVIFILLFFIQAFLGAQGIVSAILGELTFVSFIVLPLISLFIAALWGVPVFGYVLLVSALIKRAPFFMAIWPPLAIVVIEKIAFGSEHAVRYFVSLFPFRVFSGEHIDQGVISFINSVLRDDIVSIILSSLLAVACVGAAIWFRNNRFEI